jgi:hypothetical protein
MFLLLVLFTDIAFFLLNHLFQLLNPFKLFLRNNLKDTALEVANNVVQVGILRWCEVRVRVRVRVRVVYTLTIEDVNGTMNGKRQRTCERHVIGRMHGSA